MSQAPMSDNGITQDDKLWAALGYVIPLIALIVLFMEDKKNRPYVKFNAVQSLVATVVLTIISSVTCGFGAILVLVMFWWAYQAYQGQDVRIPFVSDFIRNQGWA
ncbi:MAG: Chloroplast import component protein (Tic20) [Chloroflexi bacterium OLB14]|nr:MAG: Chloroplast import component protein (Tic20) [Chloroflexi bacterium OLB14]